MTDEHPSRHVPRPTCSAGLATLRVATTGILIAVAAGAAQARAQNVRLADLSSWQPGTRLHVGVTTPDKQLTSCAIIVGSPGVPWRFKGVTMVVDPALPFAVIPASAQLGARLGSDGSDEFKFYWNSRLPAGLAAGRLAIQAFAYGAGGRCSISNGVVRTIQPPGRTEVRYGVRNCAHCRKFTFYAFDVDRGTLVNTWNLPFPTNPASDYWSYAGPPEVSPDDRWAALPMYESSKAGLKPGRICLVDLRAGTSRWLALPSGQPRQARFRPGDPTKLWVLSETQKCRWSAPGGIARDMNATLYALDLTQPGAPVVASVPVDTDAGCDRNVFHTSLMWTWTFDGLGTHAYFVARQSNLKSRSGNPGTSEMRLRAFPVVNGMVRPNRALDVKLHGHAWPSHINPIIAAGRNSRVLASYRPQPPLVPRGGCAVGSDAARGVPLTAPLCTTRQDQLYAAAAADDGSYALLVDPTRYPTHLVLDGRQPLVANQPFAMLPPVALRSSGGPAYQPIRGDVVIYATSSVGAISPLQRLSRTGQTVRAETVSAYLTGRNPVLFRPAGGILAYRAGNYTRLSRRDGLLVTHLDASRGRAVALIATETMTYAGSIRLGSSGNLPNYLF